MLQMCYNYEFIQKLIFTYHLQSCFQNHHVRDYSDDMEDREMENFKTLQKKKDRITSSDGISSRNRIQQLMESANGVPPIRARYRNGRKNEAKNNDSEHGKNKNGKYKNTILRKFNVWKDL